MKILPTTTLEEIFKYLVPRHTINRINHFKHHKKKQIKFLFNTFIAKDNLILKFIAKFWPYLIAAVAFLIYASYTFLRPGYIIYTDVTEPLTMERLHERYIHTYSDDIGESLAETARIPLFYTIYGAYKASLMGDQFFVKIKMLMLFGMNFVFFAWSIKEILKIVHKQYAAQKLKVLKLVQSDLHDNNKSLSKRTYFVVPIIFAATYYCINFWAANRIMHFHLFFSTVTIPVTFTLLLKYFEEPASKIKYLIYLAIFLGIFTATPHTVLFQVLLLGVFSFSYLIFSKQKTTQKLERLGLLAFFGVLYFLINAYWIFPFLVSDSVPDAVPSKTIVQLLSKNAELENSIRLMGYWLTENHEYFISSSGGITFIQKVLTLLPLGVFIIAIILFRKLKISEIITVLFGFGVLLASSTKLTNTVYYYLMFDSPIKSVDWIFREYDKFGIIPAFVYAVSIGLVTFYAFFHKKGRVLTTIIMIGLITHQFLFFHHTINKYYSPQEVPNDFAIVNNLLTQDYDEFNVVWYPGVPFPVWAKTNEVRFKFGNLVSTKPSITTRSDLIHYVNFIMEARRIKDTDLAKALDLVGVKYLIVRTDDMSFVGKNVNDDLTNKPGLTKVYTSKYLTVYKNELFTGIAKSFDNRLVTNIGLDVTSYLDDINLETSKTYIDFTDKPNNFEGIKTTYLLQGDNQHYDVLMRNYLDRFVFPWDFIVETDNGNADKWRKTSLENLNHAESEFFFSNLGLRVGQMDFSKGVATARDGYEINPLAQKFSTPLNLTFNSHKNFLIREGNVYYSTVEEDFKYYWNIIRSDKFDATKTKAIELTMKTNIEQKLIPHFKIYSYDKDDEILDVKFIYADQKGNVSSIVKIPQEAVYADFSVWTLSTPGEPYSYNIEGFSITDITPSVKPLTLQIEDTKSPTCTSNCILMARVLKSKRGGSIDIAVNDTNLSVSTYDELSSGRYEWVALGVVNNTTPTRQNELQKTYFTFRNIDGFNSVNAVALLTQEEFNTVENRKMEFVFDTMFPIDEVEVDEAEAEETEAEETEAVETENEETATTDEVLGTETVYSSYYNPSSSQESKNLVKVKKINPTLYLVQTSQELNTENTKYILGFAKPYNKNWILRENPTNAQIVNGYINAWEIQPNQTQYTVEFNPQRYFYIGALISGTTFGMLLIFLGMQRLNNKK